MKVTIPELSFVVLIGPSGSGKSTFARRHFRPTEVLSSDYCRGLVSDDELDQSATKDAFEVLNFIASKRLAAGRLTVVDATNVQEEARRPLVRLAREHDVLATAIVLNLPAELCHERNRDRPERAFGQHVVRGQCQQLRRSLKRLAREGFRHVHVLSSPEEIEAAVVERQPLWNNLRHERGPFDIIGDVHGCLAELIELLQRLGYVVEPATDEAGAATYHVTGLPDRKLVFLGDLVDRGPDSPGVLRLVMGLVAAGRARCLPGNHDVKLQRKLLGKDVRIAHGLAETLAQLESEPPEFHRRVADFIDRLVGHYVLDEGQLVVAHAGMKEAYQGRASRRVRDFALYGETTGETDEFGLPVRQNWAADYRGRATVVYGHTPVPTAEWLNRTINIDTGCVFGGRLSALRYPERELLSVPAARAYAEPIRPLIPAAATEAEAGLTAQQAEDDVLDIDDVLGKRTITTRLAGHVTVREENAIAALEVMSRFAADPKWLIYLPPTMSPSGTSKLDGLLEHPAEAFAYYREQSVARVICQEKHMGSRAVVIVCRDSDTARRRFGVAGGESGICLTRTGRRFFDDTIVQDALLGHLRIALDAAGFWEEFQSDWFCFDCELMPWSAKAQELIEQQYAAVGAAARAALADAVAALDAACARSDQPDDALTGLAERYRRRQQNVARYAAAYRRYCWPVQSLADLRLAPFQLLAAEAAVFVERDHEWQMRTLARLADCQPGGTAILIATRHLVVELDDGASEAQAITWWEELTAAGGEGMVVKPVAAVVSGDRGLVQPALKCRGREYLRIIYGPDYTEAENLSRLRQRSLGTKRSLARREFALGIEGLERFVLREPLRRVHECAFGVLALESEPVDQTL
jgi:protein phosphatase